MHSCSKAWIALTALTYCGGIDAVAKGIGDTKVQLATSIVAKPQPAVRAKPAVLQEAANLGLKAKLLAYLKGDQRWIIENCLADLMGKFWQTPQSDDDADQPSNPGTSSMAKLFGMLLFIIMYFLIFLIVGLLYVSFKPVDIVSVSADAKPDSLNGDFKYRLFQCCDLPCLSIFTCCCPCMRWSDSMRMLGELTFVVALLVWLGMCTLGVLINFIAYWVGMAILGTLYRHKIRKAFKMQTSSETVTCDLLTYCCCSCVAIVQEARQIEEAKVLKHDAVHEKSYPLECFCESAAPTR